MVNLTKRRKKQGIIPEKLNTVASSYLSETLYSPENLCFSPPNTLPQSGQVLFSIGLVHYSGTTTTRKCVLRTPEWLITTTTKKNPLLFSDEINLKPQNTQKCFSPQSQTLSSSNQTWLRLRWLTQAL